MSSAQKFGKYTLVERIAVGGMAEIYRAKTFGAAGFEKDLVLKRILPQFSADDDFVRMFIDEARLAAKLQHANIVQIFDFDQAEMGDGPSYYIAMELVEGKDVRHLLKEGVRRNLPMSVAMCLHVAIESLKGLHYAHAKAEGGQPLNIVHRDVSPHNLLVSYAGEVKISDFGIAKAAARASATSNGMVKGKLAYMSPEQVTGQQLDRRTDVYSCGIVLYEMLTRTRLFAGQTDAEVITKVRDAVVPPLRQRNPQVPPDVEQAVMKMLAHDVRTRYQSAAEAARALSQTSAYSANEAAPLGEYVAQLFPPTARRSVPAAAPAPQAAPKAAAAPAKAAPQAAEGVATMMADAPSQAAVQAAVAAAQAKAAAKPPAAAAPISEQSTAILDSNSPQHAQIQAQIAAATAGNKGAAPAASKPPQSIMDQSTAILDSNSPQHAQIQAQIAAATGNKGAPPAGGKPPQSIMDQSTAILDSNSPQHAQIQAQIAAATGGRGAPPPAAPPRAGGGAPPMASSGPPPMAPPPGGPPPSNATVMLDTPIQYPPPRSVSGARPLAPMPVAKPPPKQSTMLRWIIGPGIMAVTAAVTFFIAGLVLPAAAVKEAQKQPPPPERPKGRIQLKTTPVGATVMLDDELQKHLSDTVIEGPVGESYHLSLTLVGYKKHEEEITFRAEEGKLTINLDKLDEPPATPHHHSSSSKPEVKKEEPKATGNGTISIFVHPAATVFLDGERVRQTPIANLEVKPGKHTFLMKNDGLKKEEKRDVTIKPGSNEPIRIEWQ
jgi:serine/threonine-protein kinase